jgi:anti-sigma B factor antagonist
VTGALDLCTAEHLASAVDHYLEQRATRLILDLRRLEYLDSEGIHALRRAQMRASTGGCQICLIRPSNRFVQRVLAMATLDQIVPVIDEQLNSGPMVRQNPPERAGSGRK